MSIEHFVKKISLRTEEKIILIIHHHPITYARQIIVVAVLILLAFFLMFYLFSLGPVGVALFIALFGTAIFYGAREFYIWYFNVFIITNERIIDLEQKGFFNKTVSEAVVEKIIDLSYSVKGLWQTILKLGTLKIQAEGVTLLIENVADIIKVNQLLTDLIKQETGKKIEVKKTKQLMTEDKEYNAQEKQQLTEDFLNQDKLADYDDYELDELLDYYKETFGELRLKKVLVDQLQKYEDNLEEQEDKKAESNKSEEDVKIAKKQADKKANFTKRSL